MLIGWDAGVLIYLVWAAAVMMARCTAVSSMKRNASIQDEGAFGILVLAVVAGGRKPRRDLRRACGARRPKTASYGVYVALAIVTVVLSWTFTHTIFALHYAHDF